MSENPLSRRDFIRLGAGAAAMGVTPQAHGFEHGALHGSHVAEASSIPNSTARDVEMAMAKDWMASFGAASGFQAKSKTRLLPTIVKPPFSFIYGTKASSDLLARWKCEANIL